MATLIDSPESTANEIYRIDASDPLEALIRLLADQFKVPCNQSKGTWRRMLAVSEAPFIGIAHRSLSGPADE
jgi:hypothetical protein